MEYPFKAIERKWQRLWRAKKAYEPNFAKAKRPFYNLMMFPYPSAEGLHVGNMYAFTGSDVYGRMKRMQGSDVFEPMGLDGFGIHSENYALKVGLHPMRLAKKTERNFYRQLQTIGNGFAWQERLETYKPEYYRWTQWIFLQLFKRGLAYRKRASVRWCPSCLTVLADEQVVQGTCERCGSAVADKDLEQWFLRITNYAERLLQNLDRLDWSERVKIAQRNWIGKSDGARLTFRAYAGTSVHDIDVFTTRPDTVWGATFLVLAPTHPLVLASKGAITNYVAVQEYLQISKEQRTKRDAGGERETTGIELQGAYAENPANGARIPIWVSEYVAGDVGTGAIMGVPAHDERDFAFAKKFRLPVVAVIQDVRAKACLLVHDAGSAANEHWFPWLGHELKRKGYNVVAPTLPQSTRPHLREWQEALAPAIGELNERSLVIGHGLGALAALRALQASAKRVRKIILVAPLGPGFDWRKRKSVNGEVDWEAVYAFEREISLDWAVLRTLADEIIVYASENDPIVPRESIAYYERNAGKGAARMIPDRFHFDEYHGVTDFPELLREFEEVYAGEGILFNSGAFNGMASREARQAIVESLGGEMRVQYRLRDWLISRQRYWGPPIPLVYCEQCADDARNPKSPRYAVMSKGERENPGWIAIPEKELPVRLPFVKEFRPTGTGISPLAAVKRFFAVRCPRCGGPARRETDVSDTFLDSAWYFFRYLDPKDKKRVFDRTRAKKWLPVDMYIGGAEHAVLHLLYTRFIAMVFSDMGITDFSEPFLKFRAHGLLIKDGAKISKSKGNIVNPDFYIEKFGADAFRTYLMFLAPFEAGGDFQDRGIIGIDRFLNRVHALGKTIAAARGRARAPTANPALDRLMHRTIKKVTEDIEQLRFNTAVSALMMLLRDIEALGAAARRHYETFLKLLAPFAPHSAEELWHMLGKKTLIVRERWPEWERGLIEEAQFALIVQVNGKFRATVMAEKGLGKEEAERLARSSPSVARAIGGQKILNVIYVPDRLMNILCSTQ